MSAHCSTRPRSDSANAMIIALVVVVILVGVSGSYLAVSLSRHEAVEQGLREMGARNAAEAGVDRMIVKLNQDGALGVFPTAASPPSLSGTLDFGDTGTEQMDRSRDGVDNDADGSVDEGDEIGLYTGAVWSARAVPWPTGLGVTIEARGAFSNYSTQLSVDASATNNPASARFGLFGDLWLKGVGTSQTDSYRSSLGSYASQATHTDLATGRTFANGNGSVGSNGPIDLNGTLNIFGNSTAGPGQVTTQTSNVVVHGSTTPNTQPVPLAPVTYAPPVGSSGALAIGGNNDLTLPAGTYRYDSLSLTAQAELNISGDVTIYVDGTTSSTGQAVINIPAGSSLTLITNGDISVAGGGIVNAGQIPADLQVFSASNGSVTMGGNAQLFTSIYAPKADVEIKGTSALFGAAVGETVFFNGTIDFHYDEDLGALVTLSTYVFDVKAWQIRKGSGTH